MRIKTKKNILSIINKITLLDKISLFIVALIVLFFFIFFFRKSEYVVIRVKVTDQDVLYQRTEPSNWYANRFENGDTERDALGRVITEVLNVEKFNIDSKTQAVYLDLKVKAIYDSRTKVYSALGKTLIFGTPVRFSLSKITFDGFITEFPGSSNNKNFKISMAEVKALGRDVEPSIAYSIKKGDRIYDSLGNLLAEIEDVNVQPSEQVVQTYLGDLLIKYNPVFKDLFLVVKVRTKTIDNQMYMFDNLPLKIGDIIPLNFSKISIYPSVTDYSPVQN